MKIGKNNEASRCRNRQQHSFTSPKTIAPILFTHRWQAHWLIIQTLSHEVISIAQVTEQPLIQDDICRPVGNLLIVLEFASKPKRFDLLVAGDGADHTFSNDRCAPNHITRLRVQCDRRYENALSIWARRNEKTSLVDQLAALHHLQKINTPVAIGSIAEALNCDPSSLFRTIFRMVCDCSLSIDISSSIALDTQIWPSNSYRKPTNSSNVKPELLSENSDSSTLKK